MGGSGAKNQTLLRHWNDNKVSLGGRNHLIEFGSILSTNLLLSGMHCVVLNSKGVLGWGLEIF